MALDASRFLRVPFTAGESSAGRFAGVLTEAAGSGRFWKKPAMLCCLWVVFAELAGAAFWEPLRGVESPLALDPRAMLLRSQWLVKRVWVDEAMRTE